MSSTSSLNSQGLTSPGRRRAGSLAATDSSVITTDRVRPDWAKKLADARAHALRRAAAATALHNAAYMMGNIQSDSRGFSLGRRRRTMFGSDSASTSGNGTPRGDVNALLAAAAAQGSAGRSDGQSELTSNRQSSRRGNRLEDLEDLMMMEAIRLSLAAEEDRKRKEEKEAAKEVKKDEKKKAKEVKKAEKAARKSGFFMSPYQDGVEDDFAGGSSSAIGKGKAVDRSGGYVGFNPMDEPTSTLNALASKDGPQKHLEQSRSTLNTSLRREGSGSGTSPSAESFGAEQSSHRAALRDLSNASSSASSLAESVQGSLQNDSHGHFGASTSSFGPSPNASGVSLGVDNDSDTPPQGTPGTEPMFNFRSLAEVITKEENKGSDNPQYIENVAEGKAAISDSVATAPTSTSTDRTTPSPPKIAIDPPQAPVLPAWEPMSPLDASVATLKPTESGQSVDEEDEIEPAPRVEALPTDGSDLDHKHIGNVSMVDHIGQHQSTQ
jgi:hypothetical protein